ncbi:Nuclear transport factor 2 [Gryganskiella cystojenkinii]|nr:Nuclear transport factor 2 [Gryganskiella cystojenkinii]
MSDLEAIGKQFTQFYYTNLDNHEHEKLFPLFLEESVMSIEGGETAGRDEIKKLFLEMPETRHQLSTQDIQVQDLPEGTDLIVNVAGEVSLDNGVTTLKFTERFLLRHDEGNTYIQKNTFKLIR